MHNEPAAPSGAEKPPVPIESLAPAKGAAPSEAPSFQPETEARGAAPPAPAKRGKPSGTAQSADPKRENEKTLKCGECGAMNYPTEWYCESCGGELSAL